MEARSQQLRSRKLAPTIAILAMHDNSRLFRGNTQNFVDLIETGEQHGVKIYVVTPRDLELQRKTMTAYTYDKSADTWVARRISLPVVIYNRIPYRSDESDPYVQSVIRQCMEHPHIRFFNPFFFNKWVLLKWLHKSHKTKPHIPYTIQWGPQVKLAPLFARSSLIYLKPESGKAGAGIMQVRRVCGKSRTYQLSATRGKSSARYHFKSVKSLKHKLRMLIGDEQYIVQQGIQLSRYQRRPFDLRVLVQKNGKGKWTVTGVGARVAGSGSITTHVPRGGSIEDPNRLLRTVFGNDSAALIMKKVRAAALTIARQIEIGHQSMLGEMSMDIGIDRKGHIWFFEANAKPMKFDEPHIRAKSLENTVLYCKYLARKARASAKTMLTELS